MFILFLVAMSIMWIPIIQELQGGQLFIYIQAISAYLSPPIAIVYCMAISWGRMNEKVRLEIVFKELNIFPLAGSILGPDVWAHCWGYQDGFRFYLQGPTMHGD